MRLTRPEKSGPTREAVAVLRRILHWTGGHPNLTQRLCQAVVAGGEVTTDTGVDRLCDELFLTPGARERDDNLLFVRERLLRSEVDLAALLELYAQVQMGTVLEVAFSAGGDTLAGLLEGGSVNLCWVADRW